MTKNSSQNPNLVSWLLLAFGCYVLITIISELIGVQFETVLICFIVWLLICGVVFIASEGEEARWDSEGPLALTFGLPVFVLIFAPLLIGVALLCWQTYQYFRTGSWISYSANEGMRYVSSNSGVLPPTEWVGLYNLLEKIPLSVCLILIAIPWFLVSWKLLAPLFDLISKSETDEPNV
jgi:hypothetical protein